MSYPYQIKTRDDYNKDYKQSIEDPNTFGQKLLKLLPGRKNGILF